MEPTQQADNAQQGYAIERIDTGLKTYFSTQVGRDFGQPNGGWTTDIQQATIFNDAAAQSLLDTSLATFAPYCKKVPV